MYVPDEPRLPRVGERRDTAFARCGRGRLRRTRLRERLPFRRRRDAALTRTPSRSVLRRHDSQSRASVIFRHALRAIAYTLAVGKREMLSGRAELAKEEYATTWQEEVKDQPQAQRGGEPQVECGAQDEARGAFARGRSTQDQRPKDGFSEGRGETKREEDGPQREAEHGRP